MHAPVWALANTRSITLDRPRIMAILNVTPDSFSDGGRLGDEASIVDAARRAVGDLMAAGPNPRMCRRSLLSRR